jgi:arginyl-tRNA synthetase
MSETELISDELARVARELGAPPDLAPSVDRPRDPQHGDWATNFALVLARPLKRSPLEIARDLATRMNVIAAGVREVQVAPPGFINFRIRSDVLTRRLTETLHAGDAFGANAHGSGRLVVVEFVSANPTGPLHVGHGRQAALGDAISSLLEWTGWKVSREFYYNDAGVQIEKLSHSVWIRAAEERGVSAGIPEGGYHGEYIRDIARNFLDTTGSRATAAVLERGAIGILEGDIEAVDADLLRQMREFAVRELRAEQDRDLRAFGVAFDTYFLESSLYTSGRVESTVAALRERGMVYERDGALWLVTTRFGDDKDRVARKSDGTYTYFLPDVAYHVTKWERGYHRAINVQGSDHHSTVTRVRAGLQALGMGVPDGYPEYVLHQMVTVMASGEEVKISKRAGSYVTVRDLVDWVGRDAVRYFFLMRKGDSHLVFDVDLAQSQSEENPVYYIQMAHARMCGIFRVGGIDRATVTGEGVDFSLLDSDEERELAKSLLDFPGVVATAAEGLEPHRIAAYLLDTARKVHLWYHKAHVLLEGDDEHTLAIRSARLVMAAAALVVLRNGLRLLGISSPERM